MKTADVKAAIKVLKIANRNLRDRPLVNLAVAVALTALGVPKTKTLKESKSGDKPRGGVKPVTSFDKYLMARLKDADFQREYQKALGLTARLTAAVGRG